MDWINDRLDPILIKYGLKPEDMRQTNHDDLTDDPGNTCLDLVFIPFNHPDPEDYPFDPNHEMLIEMPENKYSKFKTEIRKAFDSSGDHCEECLFCTQNNEYLIIINSNK